VQSNIVPVGRDQKQHVEVTRDMAIKFNNSFGEVFTIPEPVIAEEVAVVPGIDGQKMSKSYGNTIPLFGDSPKQRRKRVMSIVTDSTPLEEPKDPEKCNVFALYRLFADRAEQDELAARYRAGGLGYGTAKQELLAKIEQHFEAMNARREELVREPEYIEQVLADGARRAGELARETLRKARRAVGLD